MENNELNLIPEEGEFEKPKFHRVPTFEVTEQVPVYDKDGNQTGTATRVTGRILKKVWDDPEEIKNELRRQRETECFTIINRGKLWYDNLTPSQLAELQAWYQAWLNVTETLVAPAKPKWIEGEIA